MTTTTITQTPTRNTQCDRILRYLQRGRRLSQSDAEAWWGVKRLASRIDDLHNMGWEINTHMCNVNGARFASYSLA